MLSFSFSLTRTSTCAAFAALALCVALSFSPAAFAAGSDAKKPQQMEWPFDGIMGKVDDNSAQRGFQVYREVCAACHGLKRIAFRNLTEIGFSPEEVKALAAEYTVEDGPNDDGEMFDRPGKPFDKIVGPYANEKMARSLNNGAYPLDLSLITKARGDGPNYVYSLLMGYKDVPTYSCKKFSDTNECIAFSKIKTHESDDKEAHADHAHADDTETATEAQAEGTSEEKAEASVKAGKVEKTTDTGATEETSIAGEYSCIAITHETITDDEGNASHIERCKTLGEGLYYNAYYSGNQIAMPPQLQDEQVTYQDDTKATKEQIAYDVVNFLQWAAEPEMEERKRMGLKVMIYLFIFTGLFYISMKRIWRKLKDKK